MRNGPYLRALSSTQGPHSTVPEAHPCEEKHGHLVVKVRKLREFKITKEKPSVSGMRNSPKDGPKVNLLMLNVSLALWFAPPLCSFWGEKKLTWAVKKKLYKIQLSIKVPSTSDPPNGEGEELAHPNKSEVHCVLRQCLEPLGSSAHSSLPVSYFHFQ